MSLNTLHYECVLFAKGFAEFNCLAQMVFAISQLKRFRYGDTGMPLNEVREVAWLDFVKDLK